MQKFIIKLFIFSIPLIVSYNIPKITHYSFHNDIDKKINSLIESNIEPMIIIGGDSRAERQIIPRILEKRFKFKTVNIGVNSGDIAILYSALKNHGLTNPNNTLIISVSSIEVNDSVIDKWGIPHAYVTYISTFDCIKLFGNRYLNMMHERILLIFDELFKNKANVKMDPPDSRLETNGFLGISGDISSYNFQEIDIFADTLKIGWYLNAKYDGIRKDVFTKLIIKIADTDMNVILFQPPVSPAWLMRTKNTYIDSAELDHSKFLKNISAQYDNISFIDFYTNQSVVFYDSMYYNSVHFNYKGAEIFTNTLIDSLIFKNLLK